MRLPSAKSRKASPYNNNGNLSQISKNNTVISQYDYDVRNQLTLAKDGANNELAKFDYDFERKRISKTSANITTNYSYAGSQVVNEYQNSNLTASYGIGAGEIVKSEFANGENNFHYTDALGSVTSLANATGSLTSRNEYNAFGELSTNGNTANSIGYTGQRLDAETGLMAFGNGERYYSPNYARFIQQDSVVGNSSMPQTMNRFAYANGNPFKYTDPSGNEAIFNRGYKWTGNETADGWINYLGSAYEEINTPSLAKLNQSLELWNEWALGVGDAFKLVGGGIGDLAGGLIYGNAGETMGNAWTGVKKFASDAWNVVSNPLDSVSMLSEVAMNDPQIFMRGLGQSSGETVIAATMTKAGSPVTSPIKQTAINTGKRILATAGETAAGKAVTRVATETVKQAGTRLSGAVERAGQFKNSLKESVGETWQKIKGADEPKKLKGQFDNPVAESIENHPNFVDKQSSLRDKLNSLVDNDMNQILEDSTISKNKKYDMAVTARALDQLTGTISDAFQNINKGFDIKNLDPILQRRIKKLNESGVELHDSGLGTHAEIFAVDQLIKIRRMNNLPVNLSDFVTTQRWINKKPFGPAKMCLNCNLTLPEVESIPGVNWNVPYRK